MPDDKSVLVAIAAGLIVVHLCVPIYIARRFARTSGRDTFRWTLLALALGVLVIPVLGFVMLFGRPPYANGVHRSRGHS